MTIQTRTVSYANLSDILSVLEEHEKQELIDAVEEVSFGDAVHTMTRLQYLCLTSNLENKISALIGDALIDLEN